MATRTKELDATVADLTAQRTNLLSQFSRLSATRQTAGEASSAESLTPSSLPPSQSSDEALAGPDADVLVLRARSITDRHITLLHSYNAVRDVGQALFGFIADGRDVRLRDVHADFDMELTD